MPLHILLYATLRRFLPGYDPYQGFALEVAPGDTVAQVIERLGLPGKEIALVLVNGAHRLPEFPLRGDERVAFFPPVGGG
jgi:sulfur carrier protein ThiS